MSTNNPVLQQANFDAFKVRCDVERGFGSFTGSLDVLLWDEIVISPGRVGSAATVVVQTARLPRELAWRSSQQTGKTGRLAYRFTDR